MSFDILIDFKLLQLDDMCIVYLTNCNFTQSVLLNKNKDMSIYFKHL